MSKYTNHDLKHYIYSYKRSVQVLPGSGNFLDSWKYYITYVTCAVVIVLICPHSPLRLVWTYHSRPCYVAMKQIFNNTNSIP